MTSYSNLNSNIFPTFGALTMFVNLQENAGGSFLPSLSNVSFNTNPLTSCFNILDNLNFSSDYFTNFWKNYSSTTSQNYSFNIFPSFQASSCSFDNFWNGCSGDTFTRSTNYLSVSSSGGKINIDEYNSSKGLKLANAGLKRGGNCTKGQSNCALKVREALQEAELFSGETGHGADYVGILSRNNNFKQISTDNINVADLPAGCVLVYGRGVQGYSSEYGHVEITTGDGRAVSDFIHSVHKKPTAIFVPV